MFSQEDVDRKIAEAIANYAQGELITQIKGIVNGLVGRVEEIGRDFQAFKREYEQRALLQTETAEKLARRLHLVKLDSEEDVDIVKDIVEDEKGHRKRQQFWRSWIGYAVMILGGLYTLLLMGLVLYNTIYGVHRP